MVVRFKRVMKSEGDGQHPSSHYLVVEDPQKPSTWHLRVRGMDGKPDHTLMGGAWAALHGGYRGNKYQGPNKEEALSKLTALYHSEGMPLPGKNRSKSVFYRAGSELWFLGIYSNNFEDREAETFTQEAHDEYAAWIKSTGIHPPITVMHQPQYEDAVHIAHYLSLVRGVISPEEFSQNLKALYGPYAIAETTAVIPVDGFNLVVGKVYDNKREVVERLMGRSTGWGMSHGFIVVQSDDKTITKYRTFEFSILPEELAANQVTAIGFVEKDITMEADLKGISQEDRLLLRDLFDDTVDPDKLEQAIKVAKNVLSGFLGSKLLKEETVDTENTETVVEEVVEETTETVTEEEVVEEVVEETEDVVEKDYAPLRAKLMDDFKLKELAEALTTIGDRLEKLETGLETLTTSVQADQKMIEALKKSDDEKVAAQFEAPNWTPRFSQRSVTHQPETEEADLLADLKDKIPPEVTEKAKNENPLNLGFWKSFSS